MQLSVDHLDWNCLTLSRVSVAAFVLAGGVRLFALGVTGRRILGLAGILGL